MQPLLLLVLTSIYFMLPAYAANMAPVFIKKIITHDYPLDFGQSFHGQRIFGQHKTFEGFIAGILGGIVMAYVQHLLSPVSFFSALSVLPYSSWLIMGSLFGFGSMMGDLLKSFFKRRIGISAGKRWLFFDQLDFVLGSFLCILPFFAVPGTIMLMSIILSFFWDIIVDHVGYWIGMRKEKW